MQKQFQSKSVPRGTRTLWRYLGALFLLFTFAIGQMWANQTSLIDGVTLPDIPSSTLNMASQTFKTPDANGWIVFEPYAEVANLSSVPTWWKHTSKNTQSEQVTSAVLEALAPAAPFYAANVNFFRLNNGTYTGAVRFTGAEAASFLVNSRGGRKAIVSLYTYDGENQVFVSTLETPSSSGYKALEFSSLTTSAVYIAYIYTNNSSNSALAEIAIKAPVNTDGPFAVTYDKNNEGASGTMTDANSPYAKDATVTVLGNSFTAPTGKVFAGWNTKADGSGTSYAAGNTFDAVKDVTLFAQWAYPATGTGTINCAFVKDANTINGTVTGVSTISGISSSLTASTLSLGGGDVKDGYSVRITNQQASYNDAHNVAYSFTVADNYTFAISSVSAIVFANGTGDMRAKVVITDGVSEIESNQLSCPNSADGTITFAADAFDGVKLEGTVTVKFYFWNKTGKRAYIKSPVTITGTVAAATPSCEDPETALSLSSNANTTVYVDDVITFSTTGGNGGTVTIAGANSETISENKWTATEGEHTFTASQAKNGDYCAQEAELKLTVVAATPVSAVTVGGPANGYKNNEVIFAATAANATQYRWTVDGVAQGSDSAKLHFTPTESKIYSIVCEAKNAFNSDWIASSAHSLTVTSLYGDLIHFTAKTSGSSINEDLPAANIGGIVGGTVHQKSQSNAKLNSGGYYSLTLASGSFQAGDTVRIVVKPEGDNHSVPATLMLSSLQNNSNPIGSVSGLSAPTTANITADIILTAGAQTIFLSRDGTVSSQNPIVVSMAVIRPMAAKSVAYDLTAVKINGTAISAEDLVTLKTADTYLLDLMAGYAAAPVVKFARQTTTTYEDDSQKVANDTITVTASEVSSKWQAQATIGTITYTVKAAKQSSAKVYYYDGSTKLGEETVAINGNPAEYAAKQSKQLASFVGWYDNSGLTGDAVNIAEAVITKDTTFYGKWTYNHASSFNIEQWVLTNGAGKGSADKTTQMMNAMGAAYYASNIEWVDGTTELDALNNGKSDSLRNYSYLGLKVKESGKLLNFRVAPSSVVKVKFGELKMTPQVKINDGEYAAMSISSGVYTYTATGEDLISIYINEANKAVVFKQIMINADLVDVMKNISYATAQNGSISGLKLGIPDETIKVYPKADEGYVVNSVTVNGNAITPDNGVYSFTMPSAAVSVAATFVVYVPPTYSVTYKAGTGTGDDVVDPNEHQEGAEVTVLENTFTAPANAIFAGWASAPAVTISEGKFTMPAEDVVLTAQWRSYFTITYMDGETQLNSENVFEGEAPVGIADPVKAFNIFKGWTLSGSDEVIDVTTLTASNTVYAKWETIDACFYYLPTKPAEDTQIAIDALVPGANGGSMKVLGNTMKNTQYGLSFESSGNAAVLVTLDKNMEAATVIKAKVVVNPKEENARGLLLRNAANSATVQEWTFVPAQNPDTLEFTYTVQAGDGLAGTNQFSIKRSTNAWLISLMVSNCAPEQYTVTYKDGENTLGTEQVYENAHPTAVGINARKKGYELQGWSLTNGGDVVELSAITITEDKPLYAKYAERNCSGMGVKFSMVPQPNELTSDYQLTGTTEQLIGEYATVTGGVVYLNNNNSSNRVKISKATSTIQLVSGDEGYIHVELDCPLKANDSIKFENSERLVLAHNAEKTSSVAIDKNTHFYVVPAAWEGKYDFYIWRTGTGCTISGIEVVRPEIYAVSFNLMGHGSAIADLTNVIKGSKIVAPTAPTDENYAFAGWYKENTLSNAWDFDNDVVAANTILYAKWLDMTDATLKSLKYGATDIALVDGTYEYNVELPAMTTAVPALTAETSNPNANAEVTNAAEFDEGGNAQSTVVVTPEKVGAATQTYIVNFSKSMLLPQVNVTEATVWDFATAIAGSTSLTNQTDVVLANLPGINNDENFNSQALLGSFNKMEGTYFQGSKLSFTTEVDGMLRVIFRGTNDHARHLQVCVGEGEDVIADWDYKGSGEGAERDSAIYVPAGKVTLKAFEGSSANNARIYRMELVTADNYHRTVNPSYLGTLCWTNNAVIGGATLYEFAGKNENNYLVFDEVEENRLEAGKPYIFMPENGNTQIKVYNTDNEDALTEDQDPVNNIYGTLTDKTLVPGQDDNMYYFSSNHIWAVKDFAVNIPVPAYYCYVDYAAVLAAEPAPAAAPGRRRVTMGVNGQNTATGVENLNSSEKPIKLLINGQIFILRGEKLFDATGRLVK